MVKVPVQNLFCVRANCKLWPVPASWSQRVSEQRSSLGPDYPVQPFILKIAEVRPKERKWRFGARLDLRIQTLNPSLLGHTIPLIRLSLPE